MSLFVTLELLQFSLLRHRHRSAVILEGDLSWAEQQVSDFINKISQSQPDEVSPIRSLIFSESLLVNGQVNRKTYTHHLGTENNVLFFIDPDFNIDALAALSGTLAAGGICFIWLESQSENKPVSNFLSRFLGCLNTSIGNYYVKEQESEEFTLSVESSAGQTLAPVASNSSLLEIPEQKYAVATITDAALNAKRLPIVITADRGRGKSTALALACVRLLQSSEQVTRIIITAPNRASLTIFFERVTQQLSLENSSTDKVFKQQKGELIVGSNTLKFMPVDQLLKDEPQHELLLVDEAAGVPVYLLKRLLALKTPCVFSTTVHGYEGAGSGFSLKFLPILEQLFSTYPAVHLTQPIRWADKDPLEQLLFDACLLKTELQPVPEDILNKQVRIEAISQTELIENEQLLTQVFSVLVTAHYQTKPSDLKMLLDNPYVQVFVLYSASNIVLAVGLTLKEGEIAPDLIPAILKGERRLKNHFLPQSILTQCVNRTAFDYRYLRVMRIAVHPSIQGSGLGTQLLTYIEGWASDNAIDFIGTSFAANVEVSNFWLNNQFLPLRVGFNADASSGEHSLLMLKGLNNNAEVYAQGLSEKFYHSFDYLLTDEYNTLSVELIMLLLSQNKSIGSVADDTLQNVLAYANGYVQYSCIVYDLHRWLLNACTHVNGNELLPLIERVFMKKSIADVCERYNFTGKKALNQYMMKTISALSTHDDIDKS